MRRLRATAIAAAIVLYTLQIEAKGVDAANEVCAVAAQFNKEMEVRAEEGNLARREHQQAMQTFRDRLRAIDARRDKLFNEFELTLVRAITKNEGTAAIDTLRDGLQDVYKRLPIADDYLIEAYFAKENMRRSLERTQELIDKCQGQRARPWGLF